MNLVLPTSCTNSPHLSNFNPPISWCCQTDMEPEPCTLKLHMAGEMLDHNSVPDCVLRVHINHTMLLSSPDMYRNILFTWEKVPL